jgi:hypothetical protein
VTTSESLNSILFIDKFALLSRQYISKDESGSITQFRSNSSLLQGIDCTDNRINAISGLYDPPDGKDTGDLCLESTNYYDLIRCRATEVREDRWNTDNEFGGTWFLFFCSVNGRGEELLEVNGTEKRNLTERKNHTLSNINHQRKFLPFVRYFKTMTDKTVHLAKRSSIDGDYARGTDGMEVVIRQGIASIGSEYPTLELSPHGKTLKLSECELVEKHPNKLVWFNGGRLLYM